MGNDVSARICNGEPLHDLRDEELTSAIINFIEISEEFRNFLFGQRKPTKRTRYSEPRNTNLWNTDWGLLIKHPNVKNPRSYQGRKFRRRFRIPYPLFNDFLVPLCESKNIFESKYKSYIPIEFKILIALRILGKESDCDTAAELASVGDSTCNYIFKKFVINFSRLLYDEYIYFPKNIELKVMMDVYSKLGFPGACGSMDGTHIKWSACPKYLSNLCTGKEGYPTLGFLCIVNHNRKILYMSNSVYGAENDIGMCHNDEFCQRIQNGYLKSIEYNLYNSHGQPIKFKGGYLLVDGGFLKLPWLINPDKNNFDPKDLYWSEWLESIRKDVECTFGILKNRFRFFKNGIRYVNQDIIDAAMKCVCILHNMLLQIDGLDIYEWEQADWSDLHPDYDNDIIYTQVINNTINQNNYTNHFLQHVMNTFEYNSTLIKFDTTITGWCLRPNNPADYDVLRELLMQHFKWQYYIGELKWPTRFSERSKTFFPICPAAERLEGVNEGLPIFNRNRFKGLYIKPSDIRVLDKNGRYTIPINNGLFSLIKVPPNTKLAEFTGTTMTPDMYKTLCINDKDRKGYGIQLSNNIILDCYEYKNTCYASMANSAHNGYNISIDEKASNNCFIRINNRTKKATLYSGNYAIPANVELLVAYGKKYHHYEE